MSTRDESRPVREEDVFDVDAVAAWLREHAPAYDLVGTPEVDIAGFPFFTQVIAGRYEDVRVSLDAAELGQPAGTRADVSLRGVSVPLRTALSGSVQEVPVDSIDGEATLAYGLLAAELGSDASVAPEGDGLRIFPGPVDDLDGATRVAAVWTPHPSTAEDWHAYEDDRRRASLPVTWAALDCPGGWAADLANNPAVLGRMTARVDTLPVVGEEHVVVGHFRGSEGRKRYTAATLYDADGRVVATAEHTWITVDPAAFR